MQLSPDPIPITGTFTNSELISGFNSSATAQFDQIISGNEAKQCKIKLVNGSNKYTK